MAGKYFLFIQTIEADLLSNGLCSQALLVCKRNKKIGHKVFTEQLSVKGRGQSNDIIPMWLMLSSLYCSDTASFRPNLEEAYSDSLIKSGTCGR